MTANAYRVPSSFLVSAINRVATGDILALQANKRILIWDLTLFNTDASKFISLRSLATVIAGPLPIDVWHRSFITLPSGLGVPAFETESGEPFNALMDQPTHLTGLALYTLYP